MKLPTTKDLFSKNLIIRSRTSETIDAIKKAKGK